MKTTTRGYEWLGRAPGTPPPNKGRRFPAEPLTRSEVEALLRQCSPRSSTGIRNRALLTVLWRGGLRIAEALALKPSDVDYDAGTLRVLHGKGDKARVVGVDPGGLAVLHRWQDRDLARMARVDPGTLNDMTPGRRRPTLGTLQAMCGALGLVLSDVIVFDDAGT